MYLGSTPYVRGVTDVFARPISGDIGFVWVLPRVWSSVELRSEFGAGSVTLMLPLLAGQRFLVLVYLQSASP